MAGQGMGNPATGLNVRIKITLAYDGGKYCGWQLQKDRPTIQGFIEDALEKICSKQVRVHGSGRTDSGVHALGQVAHFDPPENRVRLPWQKALNALLPDSIRVIRSAATDQNFHARFSALSKTYSYTLWTGPDFVYPQRRHYVWKTGPLDPGAISLAAKSLVGLHDFRSFMNTGTFVSSTWREIKEISFGTGLYPQELVIRVRAEGFLKQMARNIVGALVLTGRKKYPPHYLEQILSGGKRALAPATAPARGLCLESVEYPDQCGAH